MKRVIIGVVLAVLLGFTSKAQMIIDTWSFATGVDTTLWMDISEDYTTLIATTMGSTTNYGSSGLREIGFPFTLGATTHTKFSTNVNGTVRLGNTALPSTGYIAEPLGQNINAGPRIDAFGRAGMFDPNCYMRSAVLGDSGNRVLVIETHMRDKGNWDDVEARYVDFQVQLFEAGGFRIVYGQVDSGAIFGSTQNGVAATGNSSNKDVIFFDFATQRAVRVNGSCTLRNAEEDFPVKGRWYMLAPDAAVCPLPTALTPDATNAAAVLLSRPAAEVNALRVLLPVIGLDTVWPAGQDTFALPPLNPATTYTMLLQNLCGNDTSYRMQSIDFFTGCGAVRHLPWGSDFASLPYSDCWEMPYESNTEDFNRRWRHTSTSTHVWCAGSTGPYNSWLKLPVVYLPDIDGITLRWDYYSSISYGEYPYVELRVAPCAADGTVADDSAWVTLMSISGKYSDYKTFYANLDAWRGQRVRVAFVRTGELRGTAYMDNVILYQQQTPIFEWEKPTVTHLGDTVTFSCQLLAGVDSNVQYTLHSSMLGTTVTNSTGLFTLSYPAGGWDTVTVVLTNAYGADTATVVVDVLDCRTVTSFPWFNDFSHSTDCWEIWDWTVSTTSGYDEDSVYLNSINVMRSHQLNCYMLTQPIAVPATGAENLSFWVEVCPPLMVRVSPTASTDTADYIDTVITLDFSSNNLLWYTFNLSAYAGDTVRVGLFHLGGNQSLVSHVKIDNNDTLPKLLQLDMPFKSFVDSTIVCTATLRRGFTGQLTYTWHSSLMDTTWSFSAPASQSPSTFSLTYTLEGIDTVSVVVSNGYGNDTMWNTVSVKDCHPSTTLPWREDFQNGLTCWYRPEGSGWHDVIPYNNTSLEYMRYLYLQMRDDQQGSWIMSKEIQIPSDTNLNPRLFWMVASNTRNYALHYGVLVTTSSDYTDTANYTELYYDSTTHVNWSNYDQLSVSLAEYAGQSIHIAFHNYPNMAPTSDRCVCIDNVEIRSTASPVLGAIQIASDIYTTDSGNHAVAVMEEGTRYGLTYTWHSSLMDTTFITTSDTLPLHYTFGGTDTLTLIATNPYGADTLFAVVRVHHCPVALQAPLEEPFEWDSDLGCWRTWNFYTGSNSNGGWELTRDPWTEPYNNTVFQANDNNSWLISPEIVMPAGGDGLNLHLNVEGHTNQANVTFLAIRVSPTGGADTADFTDTLFYRSLSFHWEPITLSLEDYAGQQVRIAFVHTVKGSYQQGLFIDSLRIGYDSLPVASVQHTEAFLGDTTLFSAVVNNCLSTGLSYSWYSSMMGPLAGTTAAQVVYDREGVDTLTFIVGNAYGSDTVVTLVTVGSHPLPEVTLGVPQTIYVNDSIHCSVTINDCSRNGLSLSVHSILLDTTIVTIEPVVTILYTAAGTDTLTVVATNAYGSNTDTLVFPVVDHPLPEVTLVAPGTAEMGDTVSFIATLNDCSHNGLTITWHSTLLDTTWVVYGIDGLNGFNGVYDMAGTDTVSVTVSNLYGTASDTALVQVFNCNGVSLPYFEDFEGVTAMTSAEMGYLPSCWFSIWNGSNAAYAPHVITTGGYQYISNIPDNALFMVAGSSTGYGNTAMVTLPRMADSLQRLSIAFDYRFESSSYGTLVVGYYSGNTFTVLQAMTAHTGSYHRDTVSLAAATVPDGRIALRWTYSNSWYAVAIDNIEVFRDSRISAPASVEVDNVGDTYARVTWSPVSEATAHRIVITGVLDTIINAPDSTLGLTDLTPNTNYTVHVAGMVNGETGRFAMVQFTTACIILQVPFTTDFSDVTAGSLPVCWTQQWAGIASDAPQVNADGILQMGAGGYYSGDYRRDSYLTLPHTDIPLNNAIFAIQYHCQNSSYGTLNVGYMDGNSFVTVASLPNQGTTVRRDTVNLYNLPDGVTQLTLNWHGDYYGPYFIYIHELSVFEDGAIRTPTNLHVESVSGQCVALAWNPVDSATAYHVILDGVIDTMVSDNSVSICGLSPNTQYSVNVAGMTTDDTGRYAQLTFTTACSIVNLPWFEDFQGTNPLQCWTEKDPNVYAGIQVSNEYYWEPFCHSGTRAMQMYNYSSSDIYVASPVIEVAPGQMLVSFWISDAGGTNGYVEVGIMSNPNDSTSFIPLMQCQLSATPTRYEFDTRSVDFTSHVAIAFRTHANSNAILVDDISIEALTPCARLRSAGSYAVDAHTAVVEWQYDTASAVPNTGALITLTDLTNTSTTPVVVTATGSSHTFGGLTPGHRYQASVQALCANDTTMPLTTLVIPSGSICAERNGINTSSYNSDWFLDNVDRPYSYSQSLYPATLAATIDTLYGIAYHLAESSIEQYPNSYNTYSDGPRIVDVYIGQTTANTLSSPVSATNLTLAVQNYELPLNDTGWVRINFTTPVPLDGVSNLIVTLDDNTGTIYGDAYFTHHTEEIGTCFYTSSASYSYTQTYDPYNPASFSPNSSFWIPDIQLLGGCSNDNCLQPIVTVTAEDTHSVSLGWQQHGSEALWQVEYLIEGDSVWSIAGSTTNTTYTITGLNASTAYRVRVASICSGSAIYSDMHRVHTSCGIVSIPYYQTFRADYIPVYESSIDENGTPCWQTGNIPLLSQERGLWNTHQNGDYIISPEIGANINDLQVRLIASGSTFFLAGLKVGTCAADGSNLTWIDTITLVDNALEYTVNMRNYAGNEHHIAIGGSYENWTLYDVYVENTPTCIPVHHLALGQLDDTSAAIHWSPVNLSDSWAVYVDDSLVAISTDTLFSIGNLTPATSYSIDVREICSAGDTSLATSIGITTLCTVDLPWTENFDGGVNQQMPQCWYPIFRTHTGSFLNAYILGANSNPHLYFYDYYSPYQEIDRDTVANFVCSPVIRAGNNIVSVSFSARKNSSDGLFQAGIMTNPADTTSFIPLQTLVAYSSSDSIYQFTTDSLDLPAKFSLAFRSWGATTASVDDINVSFLPVPTHVLTLAVNDTTMGSVTGSGTYEEGTMVTFSAVPNEGYHFVMWNDSVTLQTRSVKMDYDTSFTAFFASDTVWRTIAVAANVDGVCETFGSGRYVDGDTVEIGYTLLDTATEGGHWQSLGWSDGETGNPRQIVVTSDTLVTALFQWVEDSVGILVVENSKLKIEIYPNPAHGDVTVSVSEAATLSVLDMTGRVVIPPTSFYSKFIIHNSQLPTGTYFVRVTTRGNTIVKKLIIK